jgi:hypothetical protein
MFDFSRLTELVAGQLQLGDAAQTLQQQLPVSELLNGSFDPAELAHLVPGELIQHLGDLGVSPDQLEGLDTHQLMELLAQWKSL